MSVIRIAQYSNNAVSPEALASVGSHSTRSTDGRYTVAIGSITQDQQTTQITSEVTPASASTGPTLGRLEESLGRAQLSYDAELKDSAFGNSGAATFKVVEYVLSYFPASRITPEFRISVEKTMKDFDDIYKQGASGGECWTFGWVEEGIAHDEIQGEPVKGFLVVRGWDAMEQFEASIQTEEFRKSLPLLLSWNTPHKMVSLHFVVRETCTEY